MLESKECKLDGKTFCKATDMPLKPIIARAGGKTQLVPKIMRLAPEHKVYVEPFVGGGAVFLRKPLAQKSVINDKDKDVMKVYKSFKNGQGFNKCDMTPSKRKFDRIKSKNDKSACDVAYLNKLSFGSQMSTFARKKFIRKRADIGIKYQKAHKDDYKEKLNNTTVLNEDFASVMNKYDSKYTFHYLDPPYFKSDYVYKEKGVTPKQVCDTAKKMKGNVMISYDDNAVVRNSCKGLKQRRVKTRYILQADSNNKSANELIITNY